MMDIYLPTVDCRCAKEGRMDVIVVVEEAERERDGRRESDGEPLRRPSLPCFHFGMPVAQTAAAHTHMRVGAAARLSVANDASDYQFATGKSFGGVLLGAAAAAAYFAYL